MRRVLELGVNEFEHGNQLPFLNVVPFGNFPLSLREERRIAEIMGGIQEMLAKP